MLQAGGPLTCCPSKDLLLLWACAALQTADWAFGPMPNIDFINAIAQTLLVAQTLGNSDQIIVCPRSEMGKIRGSYTKQIARNNIIPELLQLVTISPNPSTNYVNNMR